MPGLDTAGGLFIWAVMLVAAFTLFWVLCRILGWALGLGEIAQNQRAMLRELVNIRLLLEQQAGPATPEPYQQPQQPPAGPTRYQPPRR